MKKALKTYFLLIRSFLERLAPPMKSKRLYLERCGEPLNLRNPKTLCEKILYTKLYVYWNDPFIASCVDKYRVRSFIKQIGCQELLLNLYGVYDNVDQINWNSLPSSFVIKTNHGCGFNIICKEKDKMNIDETKKTLNTWLGINFGRFNAEEGIYDHIKRKIIIEEYINTFDGKAPTDYKFFCSYGKVLFILVCTDRYGESGKTYYWPNWEKIPITEGSHNTANNPIPDNLDKMIEYSQQLSKVFPLVRVDLYNENNIINFGELTFSPGAGMYKFNPKKYNLIFGDLFPNKKDIKLFTKYDKHI